MAHAYTEDRLVERPAISLFAELGWQTVVAKDEVFGEQGTLGREHKGQVVLLPRLRAALRKLNPGLPDEALSAAVEELTRDRSAMSIEAANREVYTLLKDGIPVSVPDREHGGQKVERARGIEQLGVGSAAEEHHRAAPVLLGLQLLAPGAESITLVEREQARLIHRLHPQREAACRTYPDRTLKLFGLMP